MSKYYDVLEVKVDKFTKAGGYGSVTPRDILDGTAQNGFFSATGSDADVRKAFVDFQFLTELTATRGLQEQWIKSAQNIMHTPKPATPLLSNGGDDDIVKTVHIDTVRNRNELLPEYMRAGGTLETAFPKDFDWSVLNVKQVEYFNSLCREFSHFNGGDNISLLVTHLDVLPDDMVGATAEYVMNDDEISIFSIEGQQADKVDEKRWTIWLGDDARHRAVSGRARDVEELFDGMNIETLYNFVAPSP